MKLYCNSGFYRRTKRKWLRKCQWLCKCKSHLHPVRNSASLSVSRSNDIYERSGVDPQSSKSGWQEQFSVQGSCCDSWNLRRAGAEKEKGFLFFWTAHSSYSWGPFQKSFHANVDTAPHQNFMAWTNFNFKTWICFALRQKLAWIMLNILRQK